MMNEQQLEYVRINLRAALLDSSGGTKGQLEAFAEHPPADKQRNPRKPVHIVALDDGRGGIRHVKAENSALYVLETRSRRRPLPPINEYEFAAAPWRRAVNLLSEHEQAWVRYCYGHNPDFKLQTLICQHVWETYEKELVGIKLQKRVRLRLISLVWLAVQDAAAKNKNEEYREYAATVLANLLSINRDTWYQTYAAPWRLLKSITTSLDEEVLIKVKERAIISDSGGYCKTRHFTLYLSLILICCQNYTNPPLSGFLRYGASMSKQVTESLVFRPASELPTAELNGRAVLVFNPVMVGMMDLSVREKRMARFITSAFTLGWAVRCCRTISTSPGSAT